MCSCTTRARSCGTHRRRRPTNRVLFHGRSMSEPRGLKPLWPLALLIPDLTLRSLQAGSDWLLGMEGIPVEETVSRECADRAGHAEILSQSGADAELSDFSSGSAGRAGIRVRRKNQECGHRFRR